MNKDKNSKSKIAGIVSSVALTIVSVAFLPKLINYCRKRVHRITAHVDESEIESLGPEIVKKNNPVTEEE